MASTGRAVCLPDGANQAEDVLGPVSRPELHLDVKRHLFGICDEDVLQALGIAVIDGIGAPMEPETLSAANGEGSESQNYRLSRGVHRMEGEGKGTAPCVPLILGRVAWRKCLCLMVARVAEGCVTSVTGDRVSRPPRPCALSTTNLYTFNGCILQMHPDEAVKTRRNLWGE